MSIVATYADDPNTPSSSAVRHLVTDAPVSSITDGMGDTVSFTLQSQNGGQYTYGFSTNNPGNTLTDGNYFADNQEFYSFFGDLNGDRTVNAADAALFSAAFNSTTGQPNYRSDADWNADGAVNNADAWAFRHNYGKTLPA